MLAAAQPAQGQRAVSIRAGLIHHIEGEVWAGDRRLDPQSTKLTTLAVGEQLRTGQGRAEIVLAAGRFVRVDRASRIELVADEPEAASVRLLSGSMIVDWSDVFRDGEATLVHGSETVRVEKPGRYRIDSRIDSGDASRLRVFDGKANVEAGSYAGKVKKGRMLALASEDAKPEKFDPDRLDRFDRWNTRRARLTARQSRSGQRRRGRPPGGGIGRGRGRRGGGGGIPDASNRGGGGPFPGGGGRR